MNETPERTWRDVAVYRTYPMSREPCTSCKTFTGYFCNICEQPVCDNCRQAHTDFHWQHPRSTAIHLSEVASYPSGELPPLPESGLGDVVASWSSSDKGMKDFYGQMYGHGISNEMIDAQKEMNGVHDDRIHAMAMGMLAYKRPPWYKRFWFWLRSLILRLDG